jgi:tungstate transport system ATP-binding protein
VIEVDDLEARRGAFALRIPRLEALSGRTLAVLGPNGAGKSTLLEILALLRRPDRGLVRLLGEEPRGRSRRLRLRRRLSLAMQDPFLLAGSVLDNVALPLRLRGVPAAEARRRAGEWIDRFGIGSVADRPARRLSGGQARRASLARALACEPDVLLLDEPFSALDPPGRDALLRDFQRLVAPRTAVVLVTHDRSEALGLAHDVAVLESGRLLQWGPTQEVFRRPASEEVAALAGIETLLSGAVGASADGLCRIEVAPGSWVEAHGEAEPGSRVTLCVHPEEVVLERGPRPGRTTARNVYEATVRALWPQGALCRVELECPFPLVALITRRSCEELDLRPGERVSAAFKASAVHLFPARRASS